jgi:hypothetical protein
LSKIKNVLVYFLHWIPDPNKWGNFVDTGGSEKTIQMSKTERGAFVKGKGTFTWTAEPQRDSFWYPFDSYKLYVSHGINLPYDPAIHGPLDADTDENKTVKNLDDKVRAKPHDMPYYFNGYADKMSFEFAEANLVPELAAKEYDDPNLKVFGDPFEIRLYRPFLARSYTVFVIVLMAFGLVYLYFFKDIEGSAGDLLGFFVAALGTRAILLAGVDFSPVLLDYVVVFFAILATGVVFGRWIDKRFQPETSVACPHCTSSISPEATRCPHCTGTVPSTSSES